MGNIAKLLKETMERTAKKQVKTETIPLKKVSAHYRKVISDLSSRLKELERQVALLQSKVPQPTVEESAVANVRFSPKMIKAMRQRLGLSAKQCGLLIGASSGSIGNWENGKSRPRKSQLAALAGLRSMGKREAKRKLEEFKPR